MAAVADDDEGRSGAAAAVQIDNFTFKAPVVTVKPGHDGHLDQR